MDRDYLEDRLDELSWKILEVLADHGGTATTSELKNVLGHETTDDINYRKRKHLEPTGLVEVFQPKIEEPGVIPAQEWSLTEKGLEFLEVEDEGSDRRGNLGERINLIEDQMAAIQESLAELEEGKKHNKSDTAENGQVMELIEQIEQVKSRLDEIESNPIFDEEMQTQLNAIMTFAGISKDTYIEERGDDYLDERWPEKKEEINRF